MTDFQTNTPAKVTGPVFIGIVWGATAISFLFVAMRLSVRIYAFRRLWADDYLTIAAWFMLLAQAIAWHTQLDAMYTQFQLTIGNVIPTPEIMHNNAVFMRVECAVLFLFYGCLWCIKGSFLVFFRRIGSKMRPWTTWYWCVVAFVVATWLVCIGDIQYKCLLKDQTWIAQNCIKSDAILFQYQTFIVNLVLDVLSDFGIISLPIYLLWNVRIPLRRKLMLMGLLSLTGVIIVVAIVRVAVVVRLHENADITWLWIWSFIEATVANIVASLASFRQLYMKQDNMRSNRYAQNSDRERQVQTLSTKQSGFSRVQTSSRASSDVPLYNYP